MLTIAIHPDKVIQPNGVRQSYSDRWLELAAQAGIRTRIVDAYKSDFLAQLAGCNGFMWRFGYRAPERLFAMRLMPAVEHGLGIPVFPSWKSSWHFEDKISQHYLLEAAGIPMPRTWVFWKKEAALDFLRSTTYPKVLKLATGFRSGNVRLLHDVGEATLWANQLFGPGVWSLGPIVGDSPLRSAARRVRTLMRTIRGTHSERDELQRGYLYVQEFLEANEFDTRVTVIGNRAFAYRRLNRPGDFRASGSGRPDWDASKIDLETVRLALRAARRLHTQSMAVDGMRRGDDRVLGEISYTYVSWMVRECPGHWVLHGDPATGHLEWIDGKLAPDDAIFEDFIASVRAHGAGSRAGAPAPTMEFPTQITA